MSKIEYYAYTATYEVQWCQYGEEEPENYFSTIIDPIIVVLPTRDLARVTRLVSESAIASMKGTSSYVAAVNVIRIERCPEKVFVDIPIVVPLED